MVFLTFSLPNVLRATAACTFSTSQLGKVVRSWCVLHMLRATVAHTFSTPGPGLRCFVHFDLEMSFAPQRPQFVISHLPRCPRTRRFSEPRFRPSGATKHWKNTVFRDFPTFLRTCIFSLLTFSLSSLLTSDLLQDSSSHC